MFQVLPKDAVWIQDEAVGFDPDNNLVRVGSGDELEYEYLVIAMGIQLNYHKVGVVVVVLIIAATQVLLLLLLLLLLMLLLLLLLFLLLLRLLLTTSLYAVAASKLLLLPLLLLLLLLLPMLLLKIAVAGVDFIAVAAVGALNTVHTVCST